MTDRAVRRARSPRPTVSVVIPVLDDAVPLATCLAALAAQTHPPDEIVVVDNGSSDGSGEVAARAGARVERCDVRGIPAASARGFDLAQGDLILRLDADCVPDAHWVASMVEALESRPHVAAVSGGARFHDGPVLLRAPLGAVYLGLYVLLGAAALGHAPLFGSNTALRREVWQRVRADVHRDDPEIHDDLDLSFHVGERHRVVWLTRTAMAMSMRPFGRSSGFGTRVSRGMRTVVVHWPYDFPPHRWARRAGAVREQAAMEVRG